MDSANSSTHSGSNRAISLMKNVLPKSHSKSSGDLDSASAHSSASSSSQRRGLFKRWGRRSSKDEIITAECHLSVSGHDSQSQFGGSAAGSFGSADTELMGNNRNRDKQHRWETPGGEGDSQSLSSPRAAPSINFNSPASGGGAMVRESPTGVQQINFPPIPEEEDVDTVATPKAAGRHLVGSYFDSSSGVMPLPFIDNNERVPEVTRQTSQHYRPVFEASQQIQQRELQQHMPKPNDGRSLEGGNQVARGTRRDTTEGGSVVYDHGSVAIPQNLYVDQDERTVDTYITMDTFETRANRQQQQQLGDAASQSSRSRLQYAESKHSNASSKMHFSVHSESFRNRRLPLPEDPSATIFIPLHNGIRVPLRRCPEVQQALQNQFYDTPNCPCCDRQVAVVADAAFLHCPLCREISPLFGNIGAVGDYPQEPEYHRFGLGLGMTWDTVKQVLAELNSHNGGHHYNNSSTVDPSYNMR